MSKDDIQWAVDCWFQQVSNRPIKNIHRRTLDDTWRMVIRRLGGDDIALIGPSHDGSLAAQNIIRSNYEWETSNSEDEITRLRADLAAVTEERDRMRAALEPFAKLKPVAWSLENDHYFIATDDICRARAAIEGVKELPR